MHYLLELLIRNATAFTLVDLLEDIIHVRLLPLVPQPFQQVTDVLPIQVPLVLPVQLAK